MEKLLRDLRAQLRRVHGDNYPEFTEAKAENGHWWVRTIGAGWVRTTDLLRGVSC